MIRFADLFCGIGGFRLGIENASKKLGIPVECVFSSEIEKNAVKIYEKNFKEVPSGDITKIQAIDIPDIDILCGGFPCQPFSIAGNKSGFDDPRGTLFFEVARIAEEKRPKIIFIENVKGLLNHDHGRTFGTILITLDELGYDVEWQVLNSKDFGVPQKRERVFIIGHLRGCSTRQIFPIWKNIGIRKRPTQPEKEVCQYANTLTARQYASWNGNYVALTEHIRKLTPMECERLQSYPDGWTEGISDSMRYKCLGNAVTVNVIEAIAEQLLKGMV